MISPTSDIEHHSSQKGLTVVASTRMNSNSHFATTANDNEENHLVERDE